MNLLFFFTGLLLVFGLAYLPSFHRKGIRMRRILIMMVIQLGLSFLLMNTMMGIALVSGKSKAFDKLMQLGISGVDFGWQRC